MRTAHGEEWLDEYAWLADRDDPDYRTYLTAENNYVAERARAANPIAAEIYSEFISRVEETDLSVPVADGPWWYFTRTREGWDYPVQARAPRQSAEPPVLDPAHPLRGEQCILDPNIEIGEHEFFDVGSAEVSVDHEVLAFAVDTTGDERFDVIVRRIDTGAVLDDSLRGVGYGLAFSLDRRFLFYARMDESWRQHQIWRHEIGTPAERDVLVLDEADDAFSVGVGASSDDRWIVLGAQARDTSQVWLIPADAPLSELIPIGPRQAGLEYDVDVCADRVWIVHNRDRVNFAVAQASVAAPDQWVDAPVTSEDEYVEGLAPFNDFVVITLRREGSTRLRVVQLAEGNLVTWGDLGADNEVSQVALVENPDAATTRLRWQRVSLAAPMQLLETDLTAPLGPEHPPRVLKEQVVHGSHDPANYVQERRWARSGDGTAVPMSVIRHKDTPIDGTAPGLLTGYGAYGIPTDPFFSVFRLSLLQRGFVVALAHVRGGTELGRSWYDDGKLAHKQHTFDDFIACGEELIRSGLVHPDRLAGEGGSAGGMLIGAVANQRPDLFAVLHAAAPFVDVLTTMLDPDLPLTAGEWSEWGDPITDPEAFARIRGYAPYENVTAQRYPTLLVTANINDTRVYATEPAKWVARLRDRAVVDPERPVLFRTELRAGHLGDSGRYDQWRQAAWELAVIVAGLTGGLANPPQLPSPADCDTPTPA